MRPQNGHAGSQLVSVPDRQQKVKVIGQEGEGEKLDSIEPLGPREDSDGDLPELIAGPQEHPPLQGPDGDLDDSVLFGDEPYASGHRRRPGSQIRCQLLKSLSNQDNQRSSGLMMNGRKS
jgi:hypothetical protein